MLGNIKRILLKYAFHLMILGLMAGTTETLAGFDKGRFFFMGNGWIHIASEKNGETFKGQYRKNRSTYDPKAIENIYRVLGAPVDPAENHISLRLIEFLDYLEDHLRPNARITIVSGYRSPKYNQKLRHQGKLAATASLHQYGMAVDLIMDGVPSKRIWDTVKSIGFGGAGYYHGRTVHVDVGPARSWDEKTSGVGTGISSHNKLIGLVTDRDIYLPEEKITLKFIRMTAFPINVVPEFRLVRQSSPNNGQSELKFQPVFRIPVKDPCPEFNNIRQMAAICWKIPEDIPEGRYKVHVNFCNSPWEEMPKEISTPEFEITQKAPFH